MRTRREPRGPDALSWFLGPFLLFAFVAGVVSFGGMYAAWLLPAGWALAHGIVHGFRATVVTDDRGLRLRPVLRFGWRRDFGWHEVAGWRFEKWLWESSDGIDYSAHEAVRVAVRLRDGRVVRFDEPWQNLVAEELRIAVGVPTAVADGGITDVVLPG